MSKKFSLDSHITRIRSIVEEMQKGITDFDKQVALFKEAATLIKECQAYLHTAELEVEQLVNDAWKPLEKDN